MMHSRTKKLEKNFVKILLRISPNAECVCNAVDVIEPRRDQSNLQNRLIVVADRPQFLVMTGMNFHGIFCQLNDVIAHHALGFGDRRVFVILSQCRNQIIV